MQRHIYASPPDQDPPVDYRPEELAQALAESPLFESMPEDEVLRVARRFDEQRFNAGHRITLEGLRGTDFFVILDGRARVSVDGRTVGHLRGGDFFGELGVLGDGLRFATVTAETPLHCLVLPHGELKRLLVDHPQMSINVLGEVVGRFRELAERRQAEKWGLSAG
jgi:CRP-like cAMP-binding protein